MFREACQIAWLLLPFVAVAAVGHGQDFLAEGERLLQANQPAEALVFLEASLGQGATSQRLFLYLGLAYYATGRLDRALTMFQRGLALPGDQRQTLHFNIGNVLMAQAKYAEAEASFDQALGLDPRDGDSYLNRANVRLIRQNYAGALEDYVQVLTLQPSNPQRSEISRLVELLRSHVAAVEEAARLAEARRLAQLAREEEERQEAARQAALREEERRRAEEQARLEEERRRAEEQARIEAENRRREELLARIRESLERAAQETRNLQATEGSIKKTEEELDLAD